MQKSMGGIPDGIAYFISVSEYSEALLRPFLPAQAKIFRVRNPIDVEQAVPADPAGSDRFCFVGRLAPEKGATIFAEASRLAGVRAVFVGTGPEGKSIMAANSRAELVGWQNREGVCSAIRASRAVVFPSLWHETHGLAVTEAAALGVPAIVSDACAARDAVRDGETGLLFKAGDVQDLKKKLLRLRAEPHFARRLGKTAYDRYWAAPCTLEIHIKELSDCYREMMGDVY
jgi:glycosyltransferase involved in cell wall biosynthesis